MLIQFFEAAIHQALKLDPVSMNQLSAFENKILKIELQGMDQTVFVIFSTDRIFLQATCAAAPSFTISASPLRLLSVALSSDKAAALKHPDIHIDGDMMLAQALQTWMENFQIDWADLFSPCIGPAPAALFEQASDHTKAFFKKALHRFREDFTDYLQEEKRIFPSRQEVEDFYTEASVLRDRLERLAKKIELL